MGKGKQKKVVNIALSVVGSILTMNQMRRCTHVVRDICKKDKELSVFHGQFRVVLLWACLSLATYIDRWVEKPSNTSLTHITCCILIGHNMA